MKEKTVILGTAHRLREPGKCSPDFRLREAIYSREIVSAVSEKLNGAYNVKTVIDFMPLDLDKKDQMNSVSGERNRELAMRVRKVNEICDRVGSRNCLYVSVHCNAAGADGKWHNARGWQVCISPKASDFSEELAKDLAFSAKDNGLKVRQPKPTVAYWEQSLYVLNKTKCPAVLTENLFQDNMEDVNFLLSDEGRHKIERLHVEGILRYLDFLESYEVIDRVM